MKLLLRIRDWFYHTPIVFRLGREGKYVDNAHAGGMAVGETAVLVFQDCGTPVFVYQTEYLLCQIR